jgi:hypothetical protein
MVSQAVLRFRKAPRPAVDLRIRHIMRKQWPAQEKAMRYLSRR